MRNLLASLAAAAAIAAASPAQAKQALHTNAIRTIDPSDSDYGDLKALGRAIGSARIVMLGEATHGDGSTFLAKTRVIRFLHEKLGFDVLAFESGFVDMTFAQERIAAGSDVSGVLAESVFPVWSKSDQFKPLSAYLGSTLSTQEPITLAGFDLQLTGKGTLQLPDRLRKLGSELGPAEGAMDRFAGLVAAALAQRSKGLETMDEQVLATDAAQIDAALASSRRDDRHFWRQAVASTATYLRFLKHMPKMQPADFDLRERQMASNLAWLTDKKFADKKIIVWAATSHVIRDRRAIDVTDASGMVPMGAYFAAAHPRGSYILAFTARGGRIGSFSRRETTDVGPAPQGSYEAEIAATGLRQAFVPLKGVPTEKRVGRLLGYAPWAGDWAKAVDGLFFIREMQPTSYPPQSAAVAIQGQSAHSNPISR